MRAWGEVVLLAAAWLAPVEALDQGLQRAVQDARRPALERPMRLATEIGKPLWVGGALVAIAALDRARGWTTLTATVVALAPTNLVVEALKRIVDRARPDGEHKRSNASFPSSHAANAFAIAWVLWRRWPRAGPGLFAAALVVAFSRVYLNRHYPSDVLAGAAIGLAFAWIATRWTGLRAGRRPGRKPPGPRPEPAGLAREPQP